MKKLVLSFLALSMILIFSGGGINVAAEEISINDKVKKYQLHEVDGVYEGDIEKVDYTWVENGIEKTIELFINVDSKGNIIEIVEGDIIEGINRNEQNSSDFSTMYLKPAPPYKLNGGMTRSQFYNDHSFDRHKFVQGVKSTASKTQFGRDIGVKDMRNKTMYAYDNKWGNTYTDGTRITTYALRYSKNFSTADTPTADHRVIVNHTDDSRSTEFPLYY